MKKTTDLNMKPEIRKELRKLNAQRRRLLLDHGKLIRRNKRELARITTSFIRAEIQETKALDRQLTAIDRRTLALEGRLSK